MSSIVQPVPCGKHEPFGLSRRHLMRACLATFLGLSLRDLIAWGADSSSAAAGATADHVILLWMGGGMSHIDTFDPKPGRPTAGEFRPIDTSADGVTISEIFPLLAAQMKHASLLRSIAGTEAEHERATYHLLTNYKMTPQLVHPSLGSVAAHELAAKTDLPSFVSIGGRALSAGYMGLDCEAYYVGAPGQPDPYVRLPDDVSEVRADRRLKALREVNAKYEQRQPDPALRAADSSYAAARQFMQSPALAAFDLSRESDSTRQAYGDTAFGRGCLLARRLVEQGVRFVQVNLGGFDVHNNAFPQMRQLGKTMDPAMASLIGDLAASGKLKRTMVVVLSEFGRTPRVNDNGGRDHHAKVFTAFLAGGGVRGGAVVGSSDADGAEPRNRPVRVADLHATVCAALGIDPAKSVATPIGRPMRLTDDGKPIRELLS